ncbi:cupin domain-containing protein [Flavilitoribacter nigricans]|uniref:Cupin type-1 domain-containing protein n=1 Tax=Flavilitoribacter nigricans (strain ATCC 23147 / DSM 23189 / NBRC 102662 / NCIMB 1420 / SS-2) TaxID=1122177 RepID=A0A2D0MYI9_FLAN2|nr:cupin domain-containing protein [Flavilitoribacter nigricans]PHN01352.1 hypothetical protein CRP01_37440 [Flavilitoribacter nigricans DSM 23189 = NBRC 102662]
MKTDPKTFLFADDGKIPNHPTLPLLYYRQVLLPEQRSPAACRELFRSCNWRNSWVNGVYNFHHYHSITHEVLGVTGGQATLILGGEAGEKVQVSAGDVIVIPAGVGHFNQDSSADFQVVGAYPNGMDWDLCYGKAEERPIKMDNIQRVPLPEQDPVYGVRGPLTDLWK